MIRTYTRTFLVSLLVLFCCIPIGAMAAEQSVEVADISEIQYSVQDGTAVITGYTGTETALSIPDEINGYSVTAISESAFQENTTLESIVIPDSVTAIEKKAFFRCYALKEVALPDSLKTIGSGAFRSCTALEEISVPQSVERIEADAFRGCTSLTQAEVGAVQVDDSAFRSCTKLTTVTFSDDMQKLGEGVFYGCKKLNHVVLPDSVKTIGGQDDEDTPKGTFENCTTLTDVTLSSSLTQLQEAVFRGCTSLKTVNLPESLTLIGDYAFADSGITQINIPQTVQEIGQFAFQNCTGLTSMALPDEITTLFAGIFAGCSNLTSVELPKKLQTIESGAFAQCSALTTLTLPEMVAEIGVYNEVGANQQVFSQCNALKAIYFTGDMPQISTETLQDTDAVLYYPESNSTWMKTGIQEWSDAGATVRSYSVSAPVIQAANNKKTGIQLKWTQSVNTEGVTYRIYRKAGSGSWKLRESGVTKTMWTDSGQTNGRKYQYRIVAEQGDLTSEFSNTVTIYRLSRPTQAATKRAGTRSIRVTWKANKQATGYCIEYADNSAFSDSRTVWTTSTQKTIAGLKTGKRYYFRIRAYVKQNGIRYYSAYSKTVSRKLT